MNPRETISAFLDDEPFDAHALTEALSEPAGRDLLIELIALRHLMQVKRSEVPAWADVTPRRSVLRAVVGIAAVLVALVGGYFVGQSRSDATLPIAPAATRVVSAPSAWQDVPPGGMR